jgi:hypothetical protein
MDTDRLAEIEEAWAALSKTLVDAARNLSLDVDDHRESSITIDRERDRLLLVLDPKKTGARVTMTFRSEVRDRPNRPNKFLIEFMLGRPPRFREPAGQQRTAGEMANAVLKTFLR